MAALLSNDNKTETILSELRKEMDTVCSENNRLFSTGEAASMLLKRLEDEINSDWDSQVTALGSPAYTNRNRMFSQSKHEDVSDCPSPTSYCIQKYRLTPQ